MKIWKKSLLAAAMILTMVGATGCGEEKKATEVHIGYFNNVTHAQALALKADGTLEQSFGDDVSVKWTAFNAGPAEVEALFSGDIDIGYIGPVPAVSANVKSNGDVKVLSGVTKGGAILVKRNDADIQSVADLAGKNVAIPQIGNTQHLSLLDILAKNNLKSVTDGGDVNVTAVANADVANMMERGDIDAALVPEPWGTTLLSQGAEMLLDYNEVYMEGAYDVAVVVVRKDFMEANPELVDKFLKEHEAKTVWINENKENALEKINGEIEAATGKSLSDEVITEAFGRIGVSTELNRESILDMARISQEQKLIAKVPEEADLFVK